MTLLESGPVIRGRAVFQAAFDGFDGHFPGTPLLPGFMHVQAALDLLWAAGVESRLERVEAAKFSRPIGPGEAVNLTLSPAAPGVYDVVLSNVETGDMCSRFRLLTTFSPSPAAIDART